MKKLGLGCMRFPLLDKSDVTSFDIAEIEKMVDTFIANGFTYFDTAYMYHKYQSEIVLKKVLVDRHPRESFLLATKLPCVMLKDTEQMKNIFYEQLEKTGAGYFDYYLLHCLNKSNYEKAKELNAIEFVKELKQKGKIRKIGFSFHDSAQMLDKILTENPEFEFVQLQINYLDWESETVESRLCYEVALKHNKEIIVMEPVKGGTLATLPKRAEEIFKTHSPEKSAASWAIRYAASLKNVILVLSGMSNLKQLNDNISTMSNFTPLSEEEKNLCFKVTEVLKQELLVPCTACRYCVEGCPQNIPIPELFALYNSYIKKEITKKEATDKYFSTVTETNRAEHCIKCGQCESHCPQFIDIIDSLSRLSAQLK